MAPLALASAESSSGLDLVGTNLTLVITVAVIAVVALVMGFVFRQQVLAADPGTEKMQEIGAAVEEGAQAYLARQFKTLAIFVVLVFGLLLLLPADTAGIRWGRSGFFVLGAVFSAAIGYLGMSLAVKANVRVASAARHENGRDNGMRIAFRTGGTVGMATVGLGLLGAADRRPALQGRRPQGPRGLRLRRRPPRDVHARRRWHLHQGRRRRRRPRRQDRGRHPRGRPAQRRDHRRQRRRQRRRLRRHGGRPLRVLRRHPRRRAHPRLGGLRRVRPGLPAHRPGDRCGHRAPRRLHHQGPPGRERAERHQPRLLHRGRRLGGPVGHRVLHLPAVDLRRARLEQRGDHTPSPATRASRPSSR